MNTKPIETKAQAIRRLVQFSSYGAMSQLFILDAFEKQGVVLPERKGGATNDQIIDRIVNAEPSAIEAVERQAKLVADIPLAEMPDCGWFSKQAWHGAASELHSTLSKAA